jgi:SAM-dependent methyltransferase
MSVAESDGPQVTLVDTGERMVPEFHQGGLIYAEHLTRYRSALPLVAGLRVLDIACGSGYGAQLLATVATHVYGVDLDPEAVAYARAQYGSPNVEFIVGDATAIPLPDNSVDVVVTFETIEHVEDYREFMREVKRVLVPGGVAVVSTPNDLEFAEGNHYHLHEFEYDELLSLLAEHFANTESFFQATWKFVALGSESVLAAPGTFPIPVDNLAPSTRDRFLYFYVICSDAEITRTIEPTAALGGHYSDRELVGRDNWFQQEIAKLEASGERLVHEGERLAEEVEALAERARHLEAERDSVSAELAAVLNTKLQRYARRPRLAYSWVRRHWKRSV